MGKASFNAPVGQLRGKIGNLVFRQLYGKTVVSQVPDFSRRKLSAAQRAQCQRFARAVRQAQIALRDPQRRAAYQSQARRHQRPLIAQAVQDGYKHLPP